MQKCLWYWFAGVVVWAVLMFIDSVAWWATLRGPMFDVLLVGSLCFLTYLYMRETGRIAQETRKSAEANRELVCAQRELTEQMKDGVRIQVQPYVVLTRFFLVDQCTKVAFRIRNDGVGVTAAPGIECHFQIHTAAAHTGFRYHKHLPMVGSHSEWPDTDGNETVEISAVSDPETAEVLAVLEYTDVIENRYRTLWRILREPAADGRPNRKPGFLRLEQGEKGGVDRLEELCEHCQRVRQMAAGSK